MTIQHGACSLHGYTNPHSEFVVHNCFSTATMVARTRLNITFTLTLPILFVSAWKFAHIRLVVLYVSREQTKFIANSLLFYYHEKMEVGGWRGRDVSEAVTLAPSQFSPREICGGKCGRQFATLVHVFSLVTFLTPEHHTYSFICFQRCIILANENIPR